MDARTRWVETVAGTGHRGLLDGPLSKAQFYEPGGISLLGEQLFVADTNNHAIRAVDLAHGLVSTLPVDF